ESLPAWGPVLSVACGPCPVDSRRVPLDEDDWDDPVGAGLVLGVTGIGGDRLLPPVVALFGCCRAGDRRPLPLGGLDDDGRIGDEVPVPVGWLGPTTVGRDQHVAVAVTEIEKRDCVLPAAAATRRRQQEDVVVDESASDPPTGDAEDDPEERGESFDQADAHRACLAVRTSREHVRRVGIPESEEKRWGSETCSRRPRTRPPRTRTQSKTASTRPVTSSTTRPVASTPSTWTRVRTPPETSSTNSTTTNSATPRQAPT